MARETREGSERARQRVDQSLEILRHALGDYIAKLPRSHPKAIRRLDLSGLLTTFIDHFPELHLDRRVRTLAFAAKDARNQIAHLTGSFTGESALRHLLTVRELLQALGTEAAFDEVDGLYQSQLRTLHPQPPTKNTPTANEGEAQPSATGQHIANPVEMSAKPTPGPSQADSIRAFALEHFIRPARAAGQETVTIRAGEVGRLMNLQHRLPNICNALSGRKFEALADLELIDRSGPKSTSNAEFIYALSTRTSNAREPISRDAVEINSEFAKALRLMDAGTQHLFITGKAGSGKSTLLNYHRAQSRETPVILAPTGIAGLNVGGQTIHRFFGFGIDVTLEKIQQNRIRPRDPNLYKQLNSIIIDEVSMLRADLLDCIDEFLRKFGPKRNTLFGGVKMIFIGDLYQLPPVVTGELSDAFSSLYETPYFFSAKALAGEQLEIIELEKVYRQNDARFVNLLNRIRDGSAEPVDFNRLNERVDTAFEPGDDSPFIYLTTTNRNADQINTVNLAKLPSSRLVSHAEISEGFSRDYFPTSAELAFKQGAQIMMVNNDAGGRWVNGDMGRIESVTQSRASDERLLVRLRNSNRVVEVKRHTWELVRFIHRNGRIVSEPAGSFSQLPFRLAWAVTIHKSQGQTFDHVVVDLGTGAFAAGQIYVALSRCTSLEGLVLKQPLNHDSVYVDPRIAQFLAEGRTPQRPEPALAHHDATDASDSPQTLTVVAFDEGGVRGRPEHRRLVCNLEGGGKLAIWGRDGSRSNIDAVLNAGLPCTVECDSTPPNPNFANRFGHTHWLTPAAFFRVVPDSRRSESPF